MRSDTELLEAMVNYGLRVTYLGPTEGCVVIGRSRIITPRCKTFREALDKATTWCQVDMDTRNSLDEMIARDLAGDSK